MLALQRLFALDAKNGDLVWTSTKPGVTGLVLYQGRLYTAGDATITALDARTGKT